MGSSANQGYCAFTKAVEHLGNRWSLLIVRELYQFGPQGFNQLASGLPGPISRSVLAARLRELETMGLVARVGTGRSVRYTLAPPGEQLLPTLKSLWQWAEQWVPEDAGAAQRDPTVIMWWLTHRVDPAAAPERQVVLDMAIFGKDAEHSWLLISRDAEPELCREDPLLDPDRYVYIEADAAALFPIARGQRDWKAAMADGSVHLFGDPALVSQLPSWFVPSETSGEASSAQPAVAVA
jgi:DNA-binding HxlR family transcriptional regulator